MIRTLELISTGAELLDGRRINTHAQRLAVALKPLGLRLSRDTSIADDPEILSQAVHEALARANLVFVTGGLGPTADDITVETIARQLGREVCVDEAAAARIRERFASKGAEGVRLRERQARVVGGALVLPNPVGAAPGQRIDLSEGVLILLPGPPRELEAILEDSVIPWLRSLPDLPTPRHEQRFMVTALGESDLLRRIEPAGFPPPGIQAAYCAHAGRIEVILASEDVERLDRASAQFRELAGDVIYSERDEDLVETVARELGACGLSLAVAESCTGGLLGSVCSAIPGASSWFKGGVIAYSNEVKTNMLNVPAGIIERDGAVSASVAEAMAIGVRKKLETDMAVSITGIAGPDGGTPEKPLGTVWMAVSAKDRDPISVQHRFPGTRDAVRAWSAQMALWTVLQYLKRT